MNNTVTDGHGSCIPCNAFAVLLSELPAVDFRLTLWAGHR